MLNLIKVLLVANSIDTAPKEKRRFLLGCSFVIFLRECAISSSSFVLLLRDDTFVGILKRDSDTATSTARLLPFGNIFYSTCTSLIVRNNAHTNASSNPRRNPLLSLIFAKETYLSCCSSSVSSILRTKYSTE